MTELERYSLALSKLGYAHKGSFDLAEHDFADDNLLENTINTLNKLQNV